MAGKVIPGPVVCLLRRGGLVVDVGDVTVHVVNLEDTVVVTVTVVLGGAVVAVAVDVLVVGVAVVAVVAVGAVVVDVAAAATVIGVGVFDSDSDEPPTDFWSILSELDFSDADGLDAFDEAFSSFSSISSVFETSFLLPAATVLVVSTFLPATREPSECVFLSLEFHSESYKN